MVIFLWEAMHIIIMIAVVTSDFSSGCIRWTHVMRACEVEASDEESCEVGACRSLSPALSVAKSMGAVIIVETFIESSIVSFTDFDVPGIDVDVMWKLELYQW